MQNSNFNSGTIAGHSKKLSTIKKFETIKDDKSHQSQENEAVKSMDPNDLNQELRKNSMNHKQVQMSRSGVMITDKEENFQGNLMQSNFQSQEPAGHTQMFLDKQKTSAYVQNRREFDLNSLGREMAIDLSQDQDKDQHGEVRQQFHNDDNQQVSDVSEADIEDSEPDIIDSENNNRVQGNGRSMIQTAISMGHAYRKEESKSVKTIQVEKNPYEIRSSVMDSNFISVNEGFSEGNNMNNQSMNQSISNRKQMSPQKYAVLSALIQQKTPQEKKQQYIQKIENSSKLSAQKLQSHIKSKHPKKVDIQTDYYEDWSIFENISSLLSFVCCIKRKVTKFQKNLGLGPSLYLLTLKTYLRLFLILSVLSIPSCIILASGNQSSSLDLGGGMFELFASMTLGNIGELGTIGCGSTNIAQNIQEFSLTCQAGKLTRIISFGMSKEDGQQVCDSNAIMKSTKKLEEEEIKYFIDFDEDCNTYENEDAKTSKFVTQISEKFQVYCKDKDQCDFKFDINDLNPKCLDKILARAWSSKYIDFYQNYDILQGSEGDFDFRQAYEEDASIPEPVLYIVGYCDNSNLKIRGFDIVMTKFQLSMFLVVSDIIMITVCIIAFNIIHSMQKDFAEQYSAQTIEVKDFTLAIDKVPETFDQYKNETSMKAALWQKIQDQISTLKSQDKCPANLNTTVISINIGYRDIEKYQKMRDMSKIVKDMEQQHAILIQQKTNSKRFFKNQMVGEAKKKITESETELRQQLDILKVQYGEELGINEQIEVSEEEKHQIDELKVKQKADDFIQDIHKIYITFASMKTKKILEKHFLQKNLSLSKSLRIGEILENKRQKDEKGPNQKKLAENPKKFGSLYIKESPYLKKSETVLYMEEFDDKPDDDLLFTKDINEPYLINWNNFKHSPKEKIRRRWMSVVHFMVTTGLNILLLWVFYHVYITNNFDRTNPFLNKSSNCNRAFVIKDAYENEMLPSEQRQEDVMLCFCRQKFDEDFMDFLKISFNKYRDENYPDDKGQEALPEYCKLWFQTYLYNNALTLGPSIVVMVILNLAKPVIVYISKYEEHQTSDLETNSKFIQQSTHWIANISFVLVFFITDQPDFELYSSSWFLTLGSTMGFFLLNFFLPMHLAEIVPVFIHLFKRWKDRGFSSQTLNDDQKENDKTQDDLVADVEDDEVNSLQPNQRSLNELYTGNKFEVGFAQAQITTIIFVSLMYSGGIPLMYPFCLLFLTFIYWVSKIMFLKYSQKSLNYNQNHIINSYNLIKYGILAHLIMSLLFFMNSKALSIENSISVDFENSVPLKGSESVLTGSLSEQPVYIQLYASLMIIVLILYVFNLLVINPVTCFAREGCCFVKNKEKEISKNQRNRRAKKYLAANNQSNNDIEMAQGDNENQSVVVSDFLSEVSEMTTQTKATRQAVVQYKMDLDNWKMNIEETENSKSSEYNVASNNYLNEISFESLLQVYRANIDQLSEAKKRLNLYFRIAAMNRDTVLCKIFSKKYEQFQIYYKSLLNVKDLIEHKVDKYCEYIGKKIDILPDDNALQQLAQINKDLLPDPRIHIVPEEENQVQEIELMQQNHHEGHLTIPRNQNMDFDNQDNKTIQATINNFQKQNTVQIQNTDEKQQQDLKDSAQVYYYKLNCLMQNYEEDWLRENYLAMNFRCLSYPQSYNIMDSAEFKDAQNVVEVAEMILEDPFMDKVINPQVNDFKPVETEKD